MIGEHKQLCTFKHYYNALQKDRVTMQFLNFLKLQLIRYEFTDFCFVLEPLLKFLQINYLQNCSLIFESYGFKSYWYVKKPLNYSIICRNIYLKVIIKYHMIVCVMFRNVWVKCVIKKINKKEIGMREAYANIMLIIVAAAPFLACYHIIH